MKKLLFITMAITMVFACSNTPQGEKVQTKDAEASKKEAKDGVSYKIVTGSSSIIWIGTKPTGQHTGTLAFKGGDLKVAKGEVIGGKFTTDMPSINATDLEAGSEMHGKLVGHLKSPDFFDVEKFPSGTFEITSVEKIAAPTAKEGLTPTHKITGNLTLKGVPKSISFNAEIKTSEKEVMAKTGNIVVDRTEWGIKYKSKKFFSELKDKFINDEFSFSISIEAKK